MKIKYLYVISFLFFANGFLNAQIDNPLPKYEFQFGYGVFPTTKVQSSQSSQHLRPIFSEIYWCCFGNCDYIYDSSKTSDLFGISGVYNANFSIQVSKRWRLKLATAFRQEKNERFGETYKRSFLTNLVRSDFYWMHRKNISLYSGAGIGMEMLTNKTLDADESYKDIYRAFAFHFNGLGIRVGGKIGGFLELGYGAQGIVATGISTRF